MVNCDRCGRKYPTYQGYRDHWHKAHPNSQFPEAYERKYQEEKDLNKIKLSAKRKGIWRKEIVIPLAFVIVIIVAIVVTRPQSPSSFVTSSATTSSTTYLFSNPIWKSYTVNVVDNSWINATLNPVGKLDYVAEGQVQLVACPSINNQVVCPTLDMWVLNQTSLRIFQNTTARPPSAYRIVTIFPENHTSNFKLNRLDYDGVYYFVFASEATAGKLLPGEHVTISISLTENWNGSQTTSLVLPIHAILTFESTRLRNFAARVLY